MRLEVDFDVPNVIGQAPARDGGTLPGPSWRFLDEDVKHHAVVVVSE